MKKKQCFLTALLVSLFMVLWTDMFTLIVSDEAETMLRDNAWLVFLESILVLKFSSATLLAMPDRVSIKQVMAGFISADLVMLIPLMWDRSLAPFLSSVFIAQAGLLVFYYRDKRQAWEKAGAHKIWIWKRKLIIQAEY